MSRFFLSSPRLRVLSLALLALPMLSGCAAIERARERDKNKPAINFSKRGDASRLRIKTQPPQLKARHRALWSLNVLKRQVKENERDYIRDFTFLNERMMHLYIVSDDRTTFQHLYPESRDYGHYLVEVALPRAGKYLAFAEYMPHKSLPELKRKIVHVALADEETEIPKPPAPPLVAREGESVRSLPWQSATDRSGNLQLSGIGIEAPPQVSTYQVELKAASPLVAGRDAHFQARLLDAKSSAAPVEPFLDVEAFFTALSADGYTLLRATGAAVKAQNTDAEYSKKHAAPFFTMRFPKAGRYNLWCEFRIENATLCAPFLVSVRAR